MKKFISYIITIALLLSMLPISASAQATNSNRNEILKKACIAFPEYAETIRADAAPSNLSRSSTSREVVFSEARSLSENEFIVYTEYSDGLFAIDSVKMEKEVVYNSMDQSGSMTKFDITVKATCSDVKSHFILSNLKFTIYPTTYDRITSSGSPDVETPDNTYNDNCTYGTINCTPNETASAPAKVSVRLTFQFTPYPGDVYQSDLTIKVRNNQLSVTHEEYAGG